MGNSVKLPYLDKLVGSTVTVYKGGPESRTGTLLAVKSDYLVLQTGPNQYVYYQLSQLKSVIENTKKGAVSAGDLYPTTLEFEVVTFADTFLEALRSLQLSHIQVNGGGPASNSGHLIDINSEYIVLGKKDGGMIFYRLDQVKSISVSEVEYLGELPTLEFKGNKDFANLLSAFSYKWITINAGPEKVDGILIEVKDSYVVLVKNEEVIYVALASIQFVSLKVNIADEEEETENTNVTKVSNNQNIKRILMENFVNNSKSRIGG